MGLIIIDGPKGSGKSTTAQKLVERLNLLGHPAIYHKHYRQEKDEFNAILEMITAPKKVTLVVDRLIWSEWIFGIYLEREPVKTLTRRCVTLDKIASLMNVMHILLLPPNEVMKARLQERDNNTDIDMPWELVQPLWRSAYSMSSAIVYPNATPTSQGKLINYLLFSSGAIDTMPESEV